MVYLVGLLVGFKCYYPTRGKLHRENLFFHCPHTENKTWHEERQIGKGFVDEPRELSSARVAVRVEAQESQQEIVLSGCVHSTALLDLHTFLPDPVVSLSLPKARAAATSFSKYAHRALREARSMRQMHCSFWKLPIVDQIATEESHPCLGIAAITLIPARPWHSCTPALEQAHCSR